MTINLPLAVFWLVLAALFLVGPWLDPQISPWRPFGINVGWLALLLTFWNLGRWWSTRSMQARRRRHQEPAARRPLQQPDPTFDFSDQPRPGSDMPQSGR